MPVSKEDSIAINLREIIFAFKDTNSLLPYQCLDYLGMIYPRISCTFLNNSFDSPAINMFLKSLVPFLKSFTS
jgi:hypothetical protein